MRVHWTLQVWMFALAALGLALLWVLGLLVGLWASSVRAWARVRGLRRRG
jgi:hypothetical protein